MKQSDSKWFYYKKTSAINYFIDEKLIGLEDADF